MALASLNRDANEHEVVFTKSSLENLLNPVKENNIVEQVSVQDLVQNVSGVKENNNRQGVEDEQNHVADEEVYSFKQHLQGLAIARSILEQHGPLIRNCIRAFHNCQWELRLERQKDMKKTTIHDHFGRK